MIEVENLRRVPECVLRSISLFERVLLGSRCQDNVLWQRTIPIRAIVPERRLFDADDEPMLVLDEETKPDHSIVCCWNGCLRTSCRVRSVKERREKTRSPPARCEAILSVFVSLKPSEIRLVWWNFPLHWTSAVGEANHQCCPTRVTRTLARTRNDDRIRDDYINQAHYESERRRRN